MMTSLINRNDGIKWQTKGALYTKRRWDETLSSEMLLTDKQIAHLDQFLSNFGLIEQFGDYDLLVRTRFGISIRDGYMFVLVPYEDGYKTEHVQYTIKILGEN